MSINKNFNEILEMTKGVEEAVLNSNLHERARAVIKGSLDSCFEYARKGDFETAKNLIRNLSIYSLK